MSEETQHKSSHMHVLVITSMLCSQGFQSVLLLFFIHSVAIETRLEPTRYRQCECAHSWRFHLEELTHHCGVINKVSSTHCPDTHNQSGGGASVQFTKCLGRKDQSPLVRIQFNCSCQEEQLAARHQRHI